MAPIPSTDFANEPQSVALQIPPGALRVVVLQHRIVVVAQGQVILQP